MSEGIQGDMGQDTRKMIRLNLFGHDETQRKPIAEIISHWKEYADACASLGQADEYIADTIHYLQVMREEIIKGEGEI